MPPVKKRIDPDLAPTQSTKSKVIKEAGVTSVSS